MRHAPIQHAGSARYAKPHSKIGDPPGRPRRTLMTMIDSRRDIGEFDLAELEDALAAAGAQRFHARQIFQWVHRRGVTEFAAMTDLARALRQRLGGEFRISTPELARTERSIDGT